MFTGTPDAPLQIARVRISGRADPAAVRVEGEGLTTAGEPRSAGSDAVEVPVDVGGAVPGDQRAARAIAADTATSFVFTVAEPGWTMYMVSHFHYDPVWWNTQGAYTSVWTE